MTDMPGLSIGATNWAVARIGEAPVLHRLALLLSTLEPTDSTYGEHGVPGDLSAILANYVAQISEPTAAGDGDRSGGKPENVLARAVATALDGRLDDDLTEGAFALAVPAHWGHVRRNALRDTLANAGTVGGDHELPQIVSDAVAALAVPRELPTSGVVVVCDFGASGTSITLTDIEADVSPREQTMRYSQLAGRHIDQALVAHVCASQPTRDGTAVPEAAHRASLANLSDQCRQAKERLSTETVTVLAAELTGLSGDILLTRPELENLIEEPLLGFMSVLDGVVVGHKAFGEPAAVVMIGGGAHIPILTQRISERLRLPVMITAHPACDPAVGAALLAARDVAAQAPTMARPAARAWDGTALCGDATMAAPRQVFDNDARAAAAAATQAWAWSQAPAGAGSFAPGSGGGGDFGTSGDDVRRAPQKIAGREDATAVGRTWSRGPQLVLYTAAAAAVLATGAVTYTLTSAGSTSSPAEPSKTVAPSRTASADPTPPSMSPPRTVTVTGDPPTASPDQTFTSAVPRATPTATAQTPPVTATTTTATTTATTTPPTTTSTTTTTTTTQPSTLPQLIPTQLIPTLPGLPFPNLPGQ